ncbi:MAG TPA: kelch repeat-containing protein, partial [Terracidiphilus sp.]|nr:kelch repeat-containing protein [Terracidiphilus sp.]
MNRAARFLTIFGLFLGVFASQVASQAPASNTWTVAGHLTQARSGAAAVLLTDGRVLITGGTDSTGIPQATAEVYDPAKGTYTASLAMKVPRANHAAIVMRSGDVLVTGGLTTGGGYSDSAEIYSVSSQQWTLLPSSIGTDLAYHAMAQLSDGNILIAGGTSTTKVVGSLVLFNLTDQNFMPIGMLQTPRTNAVAAATPDGRVLIAGGTDINGAVLASTEMFVYNKDTMTGSISSGPSMAFPRVGATATITYDGVAVIGGNNGQIDLGTAEIFSQWTNTFKTVSGGTPRSHHFA